MNAKILTVDDREGIRIFIQDVLSTAGYDVDVACDGAEAFDKITKKQYNLIITDLMMPKMDGMTLLKKVTEQFSNIPVIVLTAHGSINNAVEAMKDGAVDYLTKPLESPGALRDIVKRTLIQHPIYSLHNTGQPDMVADSAAMQKIVSVLHKVAPTDATVLLTGQSGTGKEVAAQIIHKESKRNTFPFVAINCAAISAQLIESELFGHEKGAFTGAHEQKHGRFETADNGTLFLDEVGELPLELQAKLLRVLQEQKFERVGGTKPIEVNVRIVAATNRELAKEIERGSFREDLYHRLSVFPVHLPPLAERSDDILPLTNHFLQLISEKQSAPLLTLTDDAKKQLQSYHWPGNIRELANTLERAAILCTAPNITREDLMLDSAAPTDAPANASAKSLKQIEKAAIERALAQTDGHRKKAAAQLGIGLRTLYNKLKEYEID